nr:hypothetical protein [Desulfobacterales bacterium]
MWTDLAVMIVTVIGLLELSYLSPGAYELTVPQIVEGLDQSREAIRTGEVRCLFHEVQYPMKSSEEIQRIAEEEISRRRRKWLIPPESDPQLKALFEEKAQGIRLGVQKRYGRWEILEERKWIFALEGRHTLRPTKAYRYRLEIQNKKQIPCTGPIARHLGWNYSVIQVFNGEYQVRLEHTEFEDKSLDFAIKFPAYGGVEKVNSFKHIELLGRPWFKMSHFLSSLRILKKELRDGIVQYLIEYTTQDKDTVKLWIQPERGFTVSRAELFNSEGKLTVLAIFDDYLEFSGVWYPTDVTEIWLKGIRPGKEIREEDLRRQRHYKVLEARFNFPVDEKTFTLKIPKGVMLMDLSYDPPLYFIDGKVLVTP